MKIGRCKLLTFLLAAVAAGSFCYFCLISLSFAGTVLSISDRYFTGVNVGGPALMDVLLIL